MITFAISNEAILSVLLVIKICPSEHVNKLCQADDLRVLRRSSMSSRSSITSSQ